MMQDILEPEGYGVLPCTNGAALEAALQASPDLIILDVLLQGEDGRELCRQVKSDARARHLPVILYSAKRITTEEQEASHADAFLKKPFHLQELLALVQQYT
jgi:CheY-like chemotaxis protein